MSSPICKCCSAFSRAPPAQALAHDLQPTFRPAGSALPSRTLLRALRSVAPAKKVGHAAVAVSTGRVAPTSTSPAPPSPHPLRPLASTTAQQLARHRRWLTRSTWWVCMCLSTPWQQQTGSRQATVCARTQSSCPHAHLLKPLLGPAPLLPLSLLLLLWQQALGDSGQEPVDIGDVEDLNAALSGGVVEGRVGYSVCLQDTPCAL